MKINWFLAVLAVLAGALCFIMFSGTPSIISKIISTILTFASLLACLALNITGNDRGNVNSKVLSGLFILIFVGLHFLCRFFMLNDSIFLVINGFAVIIWLTILYGIIKTS